MKDLNVRPETIKLLEENICSMLFDIHISNVFLDMSPLAREIKTKINKYYIRLKSFCTVKETINRMKVQDWFKMAEWKNVHSLLQEHRYHN